MFYNSDLVNVVFNYLELHDYHSFSLISNICYHVYSNHINKHEDMFAMIHNYFFKKRVCYLQYLNRCPLKYIDELDNYGIYFLFEDKYHNRNSALQLIKKKNFSEYLLNEIIIWSDRHSQIMCNIIEELHIDERQLCQKLKKKFFLIK